MWLGALPVGPALTPGGARADYIIGYPAGVRRAGEGLAVENRPHLASGALCGMITR